MTDQKNPGVTPAPTKAEVAAEKKADEAADKAEAANVVLKEKELSKERELLQKRVGEIVKEYGGMESSIPLSHEYWTLNNRLKVLGRK